MRFIIRIGHLCNNACSFCHASQESCINDSLDRIARKVSLAKALGASSVILSGGEPTIHPNILEVAQLIHAHRLGLGLITNARRLSDDSLTNALLHYGLHYVYASLHAPSAQLHNQIVQAQAFDQSLKAIHNMHSRVEQLYVNAVLTNSNLHTLDQFVELLAPLPNTKIKFTFPQPKGSALASFDTVVPNIEDAASRLSAVLSRATARLPRTRFGHEGFPLCLLPGFEDLHDDLLTHDISHISNVTDDGFEPVDHDLFVHAASCQTCSHRPLCPGIYREYLQRNVTTVLRPDTVQSAASRIQAREQAAQERRAWVRLTFACNNNCIFCLDKDLKSHKHRALDLIQKEIIDGRKQGATRLVLSGGEASIHPHFFAIVRFAKLAGYSWIQTITNGRMWSYPGFLDKAVNAGIREVTFSIHGDNSALHDRLVGVPGAFNQAFNALTSALSNPNLVVSVDIVINGHNVDALPRIMQTFADVGVREFDLLHIVPFGSAWDLRDSGIFYDPQNHLDALRAAFAFSKRQDMHVWLNRFPPQFTENFEDLIQDPYKLLDEVRGRQSEFDQWMRDGIALPCREPQRCKLCYLKALCDSASSFAKADLTQVQKLEIRSDDPERISEVLEKFPSASLRIRPSSPYLLREFLHYAKASQRNITAIVAPTPQALLDALKLPDAFDLVVELTHDTAALLEKLTTADSRIIVRQPAYSSLRDHADRDVDLAAWMRQNKNRFRTENITPCLGGHAPDVGETWIDVSVFEPNGLANAFRFAQWFVVDGVRAKSLRCQYCTYNQNCQGMPLNFIRAHGFSVIQPALPSSQPSLP